MMNLIRKEGNLVFNIFKGSMTFYPRACKDVLFCEVNLFQDVSTFKEILN